MSQSGRTNNPKHRCSAKSSLLTQPSKDKTEIVHPSLLHMAILQMTMDADGGRQLYLSPIYRPRRMVGRGEIPLEK